MRGGALRRCLHRERPRRRRVTRELTRHERAGVGREVVEQLDRGLDPLFPVGRRQLKAGELSGREVGGLVPRRWRVRLEADAAAVVPGVVATLLPFRFAMVTPSVPNPTKDASSCDSENGKCSDAA